MKRNVIQFTNSVLAASVHAITQVVMLAPDLSFSRLAHDAQRTAGIVRCMFTHGYLNYRHCLLPFDVMFTSITRRVLFPKMR